jgi:hypothetical protein
MRLEGASDGKDVPPTGYVAGSIVAPLAVFGAMMMNAAETQMAGEDDKDALRLTRVAARQLIHSQRDLIMREAPEIYHECGSIESLKKMARRAFEMTIAENIYMTDEEVINEAFNYAATRGGPVLGAALMLPAVQLRVAFGARWYEQTMPRVVWADPHFPEMLMASKADASVESLVVPPWRAFVIDLPRGLLFTKSPVEADRVDELVHVLVHVIDEGKGLVWNFVVEGDDGCEMWRHGLSTALLLRMQNSTINPDFCLGLDASDRRVLILIGRLIIGTCLTLSDPTKIREAKRTKKRKGYAKRSSSSMPMTRNFVVGQPIQLHCRETLQEWVVKGNRKGVSPNVQTLVRGHWKMQAHGAQNALRKLVHLEPYWRGVGKGNPTVTRNTEL